VQVVLLILLIFLLLPATTLHGLESSINLLFLLVMIISCFF
jgi:hypothetical protein